MTTDNTKSIFCDSHIHTSLCNHASGEMEEYVQAAINNGLKKIIFLEHMEEGIRHAQGKTWLSEEDFDDYFRQGRSLQIRYSDRIEIGLGVECGFNPDWSDRLRERLFHRTWDQVGISCHFLKIDGLDLHLNLLSRKEQNILLAREVGIEKILDRYFRYLTEAVLTLPGTVLCHLDAALRHLPGIRLTDSHYQQIDTLLQAVQKKNMALEINTSGFEIRQEQFPCRRILAMAKSYNIPFVVGSDAHKPSEVGRYFELIDPLLL